MNKSFYLTHTGRRVDPNDLSKLDLSLEDISHHLAKIQRFGGALNLGENYSVGHHSILMALVAKDRFGIPSARACLLHDASEAYIGDIVSPLKAVLSSYKKLENKLTDLIFKKYNIEHNSEIQSNVKTLDRGILLDEVRAFFFNRYSLYRDLYDDVDPLYIEIDRYVDPEKVKNKFLDLCEELDIRD